MLISFLERRLKNRLKLATSYLFYATLYRKGRIMPNQKQFLSLFYNDCRIRIVVDSNNEVQNAFIRTFKSWTCKKYLGEVK